jgi:hypothetical protein
MKHGRQKDLMLFVGYARAPQGTTAGQLYQVVGVALQVDVTTGMVVEASCSLALPAAEAFVTRLLVGYSLHDGIDALLHELEQRFHGPAQRAVAMALKAAYERFRKVAAPEAPVAPDVPEDEPSLNA